MKLKLVGYGHCAVIGVVLFGTASLASGFNIPPPPSLLINSSSGYHAARSPSRTTKLASSSTTPPPPASDNNKIDWSAETKEIIHCISTTFSTFTKSSSTVEDVVKLCDAFDLNNSNKLWINQKLQLRQRAMELQRYELLTKLMKSDYDAYIATASFLSPSRIPRLQLPNVQDVPMNLPGMAGGDDAAPTKMNGSSSDGMNGSSVRTIQEQQQQAQQQQEKKLPPVLTSEEGAPLVPDCELEDLVYKDSALDKALLFVFRKLVAKNTNGVTSDKPGIEGLLEQGRKFMLQPNQTPEAQHKMVRDTLGGLMTPVLPPFYRIFMSGIVPKIGSKWDGKQIGPWFYAPFLTSFVTPTFFGFLVGPSYVNRRKDGQLGGLVVEKCKFLQESGCKGLCLHQCKLPAQQFFKDELGLPLTVIPNFETQECQWSFGEEPVPPNFDPYFPKGCLSGCESRKAIAASGSKADICN